MDDHGIKPEWKEAWQINQDDRCDIDGHASCQEDNLADLAVHLLAIFLESEFRREHVMSPRSGADFCVGCNQFSYANRVDLSDPRHNYKYEDWCRVAREKLSNG